MQSPLKITVSYSLKNFVLNKKAHLSFMCLNHFLNISLETDIIFPLNHSFLKSKLQALKNQEAISASRAFHIIITSLSHPHL